MTTVTGESSALLAAAHWVEAFLHGPAATTIAVLAVAATGLMMLTGRLPVRRGLVVALGCFVLFGASAIARGLVGSATSIAAAEPVPQPTAFVVPAFEPPPPPTPTFPRRLPVRHANARGPVIFPP